MKGLLKIIIPILLVCGIILFHPTKAQTAIKEGDIVFQISKSRQSFLIQYATVSPMSHCGIIVEKNKQLYVLEASNVVKLTPYKQWVKNGRFGIVEIYRVTSDSVKINYSKYLDKPYDLAFKFGNNKWYCSELVYDIYQNQLRIKLCKPKQIKEYNTFGLISKIKQRGMKLNQYVVSPKDLLDSKFLHKI
nr:MAG TPA: Permuted papain-like amidase enzyme, YaeF/YiiX, C92 family [Caudoviricetes sp.]